MSNLESIKQAIVNLSTQECDELEDWLVERALEDDEWDLQMKADAAAGRLNHLVERAKADYEAGRTRELP